MAKLDEPVKGHEELKEKARKAGLKNYKGKFGRVGSFHKPRKKK